jgi:hypothetical protein
MTATCVELSDILREIDSLFVYQFCQLIIINNNNSVALVRGRILLTEQKLLFSEVSANFSE